MLTCHCRLVCSRGVLASGASAGAEMGGAHNKAVLGSHCIEESDVKPNWHTIIKLVFELREAGSCFGQFEIGLV